MAATVMLSMAACNSKTAFNYSQDIVKKEKSLMAEITTTEDNVKNYMENEQYDSIAYAGERMEKIVDVQLKEIKDKAAPDVKEGENFKEAAIKYFTFIKSMYSGYKSLGSAATPEDREEELLKLSELVGKKEAAVNDMQKAQKKYAEANGFKLELK